jgi:hypothetical protein
MMTPEERAEMAQDYAEEDDILLQALDAVRTLNEINAGLRVVVPKSKEHAYAMMRVCQFYLDNHIEGWNPQITNE